jgi:hypothetical protein
MVAGIDSENDGSLRFHARAGFLETGRMPEVGQMRGSWRDLVLVQKILTTCRRSQVQILSARLPDAACFPDCLTRPKDQASTDL